MAKSNLTSVEMMKQKEFNIPFSGLKQGKHEFDYKIENKFFESFGYDEFNDAKIDLHVGDTSREPYDQKFSGTLELVVKFGDEYNDENDEILVIPHSDHQLNIAQFVYEMLVLAVPQKRVHPGVLDGTLKSEALIKLEELSPKEERDNKEDNDPRWDELKKLKTDK
jgi:hypothetical protein